MVVSVQCFIKKDKKILMLHRTKKKIDINNGKWIGVGGKLEFNESPEEALIREVKEETGLTLNDFKFLGVVTYAPDKEIGYDGEISFIYTSDSFSGEVIVCDEGDLKWIEEKDILKLNLWESDYELHRLIDNGRLFSMKVITDGGLLNSVDTKIY